MTIEYQKYNFRVKNIFPMVPSGGVKVKNIDIFKCSKVPLVGTLNLCLKMPDSIKNDDSVKEAPAYCRSFLDGLNKLKGRPKTPYFNVLKCFVMICNGL